MWYVGFTKYRGGEHYIKFLLLNWYFFSSIQGVTNFHCELAWSFMRTLNVTDSRTFVDVPILPGCRPDIYLIGAICDMFFYRAWMG